MPKKITSLVLQIDTLGESCWEKHGPFKHEALKYPSFIFFYTLKCSHSFRLSDSLSLYDHV